MKHDFYYISKKDPHVVKAYKDLIELLGKIQKTLKKYYTFQYKFIGSYARNMITYDKKGNTGFDFDVNIYPNDNDETTLTAEELRLSFKEALDKYGAAYGFAPAEDSTRVLTIKVKDRKNSRVVYSVDFAIVHDYIDNGGQDVQEYVRNNKKQRSYTWESQPKGYHMLPEKIKWVKDNGLWQQVRNLYLDKKNKNEDPHIHSRTIFAITIHEICQQNGYYRSINKPLALNGRFASHTVKPFWNSMAKSTSSKPENSHFVYF